VKHLEEKIQLYCDLLVQWNSSINLIGRATIDDIMVRHVLDSLQLLDYIPDKSIRIADLGTGAGLPGVPLSIGGCSNISLIESDQKKCTFLREVKRRLDLPYEVVCSRIESLPNIHFDMIVSRALASLNTLLSWSEQLLSSKGRMLLLKGERFMDEIEEAQESWVFDYNYSDSKTGCGGVVLEVQNIKRR
jgi:16S rRNA (guanine527-N7)-methyltransferase